MRRKSFLIGCIAAVPLSFSACSFDYSALSEDSPESLPDVVMSDVEYVRVRDGKAVVRLQAESLERYEKDRRMVVKAPRFAQFSSDGTDGAVGGASSAVIDLSSGDVAMYGGVMLSIPSEEMIIETDELSWKDDDRMLRGAADKPVLVKKADGSYLAGLGFSADARGKSWELDGSVSGTLVEEEKAVQDGEAAADDQAPTEEFVESDAEESDAAEFDVAEESLAGNDAAESVAEEESLTGNSAAAGGSGPE